MRTCIQALERIKEANRPAPVKKVVYDYDKEPDAPAVDPAAAVADEISLNLEALVGTTEDTAPKAEPKHPVESTTTSNKFSTMNLQFGRNYDPNAKK